MLDSPERIHANPYAYARHLAGYIKDPSTIRARTLEMFGRAPSNDWLASTRADIEAAREREAVHNPYLRSKYDGHRKLDIRITRELENEARKAPRPTALSFRFIPKTEEWRYSWRALILAVASDFGLTYDDVVGRSNVKCVMRVRHLLVMLMWERCGSYVEAARRLGRSDHTTARNSVRVFPKVLVESPAIAEAYRRYSIRRGK